MGNFEDSYISSPKNLTNTLNNSNGYSSRKSTGNIQGFSHGKKHANSLALELKKIKEKVTPYPIVKNHQRINKQRGNVRSRVSLII